MVYVGPPKEVILAMEIVCTGTWDLRPAFEESQMPVANPIDCGVVITI